MTPEAVSEVFASAQNTVDTTYAWLGQFQALAPVEIATATVSQAIAASKADVATLTTAVNLSATVRVDNGEQSYEFVVQGDPTDVQVQTAVEEWLLDQGEPTDELAIARGHALSYFGQEAPLEQLLEAAASAESVDVHQYATRAAYRNAIESLPVLVLEQAGENPALMGPVEHPSKWAISSRPRSPQAVQHTPAEWLALREALLRSHRAPSAPLNSLNSYLDGPDLAVRGEPLTYTLDAPTSAPDEYTFDLDWDNDNIVDQTVVASAGATISHLFTDFARDGNGDIIPEGYDIQVTVSNSSGVIGSSVHRTTIAVFKIEPDANNPSVDNLVMGTSEDDDYFGFMSGATPTDVVLLSSSNGTSLDQQFTVPDIDGRVIAYAQAGNDTLNAMFLVNHALEVYAGAGHDFVLGGAVANLLFGGSGDDTLSGSVGEDTVYGGEGDDSLLGGIPNAGDEADDLLFGGAGNDALIGDAGNDTLHGGAGNDVLIDGPGNDEVYGGADNDYLVAGAGDDLLDGGADGDGYAFVGDDLGSDTVVESADADQDGLNFSQYTAGLVVLDLASGAAQVVTPNVSGGLVLTLVDRENPSATALTTIEMVWGSVEADFIAGNARDNVLIGSLGDDTLQGFAGNDALLGSDLPDEVTGEVPADDGDDSLEGGAGDDILLGMSGNDTLRGGDGNDALIGGALPEMLGAIDGSDQLFGDDGNDLLAGSEGADWLEGGAGDDFLVGWFQDEAGGFESSDDGPDMLVGGDGDDSLRGGVGDDSLAGGAGADLLLGGTGDDELAGGEGNDLLVGEEGADTLDGGLGEDLLIGGGVTPSVDSEAWGEIADEWRSSGDYVTRASHLSGEAGGLNSAALDAASLVDDETLDTLVGDDGRDWFPDALFEDTLVDAASDEALRPNQRPKLNFAGNMTVQRTTTTTTSSVGLFAVFDDPDDSDSTITYEIVDVSGDIFDSVEIDEENGLLIVTYAQGNSFGESDPNGQIIVKAKDGDGFDNSNGLDFVLGIAGNNPPNIQDFIWEWVGGLQIVLSGMVYDEHAGDLTVYFYGIPQIEGETADVTGDNYFELWTVMTPNSYDVAYAQTWDEYGALSNLAYVDVVFT